MSMPISNVGLSTVTSAVAYISYVDYYSFAGNIATGKSTTAARVADDLRLPLVRESVESHPYLERFYDAPAEWAFRLQMYNLADRSRRILEAASRGSFVLDRSFEEDFIYVDVALDRGYVSTDDVAVYGQLFDLALMVLPSPTKLFYLRVSDPSTLRARIIARSRKAERAVDLEYLQDLQARYDTWFESYRGDKVRVESKDGDFETALRAVIARLP